MTSPHSQYYKSWEHKYGQPLDNLFTKPKPTDPVWKGSNIPTPDMFCAKSLGKLETHTVDIEGTFWFFQTYFTLFIFKRLTANRRKGSSVVFTVEFSTWCHQNERIHVPFVPLPYLSQSILSHQINWDNEGGKQVNKNSQPKRNVK